MIVVDLFAQINTKQNTFVLLNKLNHLQLVQTRRGQVGHHEKMGKNLCRVNTSLVVDVAELLPLKKWLYRADEFNPT